MRVVATAIALLFPFGVLAETQPVKLPPPVELPGAKVQSGWKSDNEAAAEKVVVIYTMQADDHSQ